MKRTKPIALTIYDYPNIHCDLRSASELWGMLPQHLIRMIIDYVDRVIKRGRLEGEMSMSANGIRIENLLKEDFLELQHSYYHKFANNVIQFKLRPDYNKSAYDNIHRLKDKKIAAERKKSNERVISAIKRRRK